VRTINVDRRDGGPIVREIAASKVLIGRSGGRFGTPFGCQKGEWWCNDRFEVAAKAAGAKYLDVINTGRVKPNYQARQKGRAELECQSTRNYCESWQCHSLLFKQPVDVELETFNIAWEKVLAELGEVIS
jgi:hypothetical protein